MTETKPIIDEIGKDGKYYVKKSTFRPEKVVLRADHKDTTSPGTTFSAKYKYTTPNGEVEDLIRDNPPTETALYGASQYDKTGTPTVSTKWEMVTGGNIVEKLPEGFSKDEDAPIVERDANRNIISVKDRVREFYIHEGPTGNARRDERPENAQAVLESTQLAAMIESTILEKAILLMGKPLKGVIRVLSTSEKTGLTGVKVTMGQSKAKTDHTDPITGVEIKKGTLISTPTIFIDEKKTMPLADFIKQSAGARVQVRRSWPSVFIDAKLNARVRCTTYTVLAKRLGDDPKDKSSWMTAHADEDDDEGFQSAKRVKVDSEPETENEAGDSFFQEE